MRILSKGLTVLGMFGHQHPAMIFSETAQHVDVAHATARRVLRTLTELGYVKQNGRRYALALKILDLGFAYLSIQTWIDHARPLLRGLSERFQDSSSASILQGTVLPRFAILAGEILCACDKIPCSVA